MSRPWVPLFTGNEAANLLQAAVDVHSSVHDQGGAVQDWGPMLLALYLSRAQQIEGWATAECDWDALTQHVGSLPCLYSGFVGAAWMAAHSMSLGVNFITEDTFDDVDDVLDELSRSDNPWHGQYDLISGITGWIVYYLERPRNHVKVAAMLARIVQKALDLSTTLDGLVTWRTAPHLLPEWQRAIAPAGYFNVGVAHGAPGILRALAAAWRRGVRTSRIKAALSGGVEWVLAQGRPDGRGYPSWIRCDGNDSEADEVSRLAWCYGDLGVAVILLGIAHDVGWPDLEVKAIDIARTAARRPKSQSRINDTGLCHGAAGVAHLFNRLYQYTLDAEFQEASRMWFRHTLQMRVRDGFGGFQTWEWDPSTSSSFWRTDARFLSGATGTALALVAAASEIEPRWDRLLLASTWDA